MISPISSPILNSPFLKNIYITNSNIWIQTAKHTERTFLIKTVKHMILNIARLHTIISDLPNFKKQEGALPLLSQRISSGGISSPPKASRHQHSQWIHLNWTTQTFMLCSNAIKLQNTYSILISSMFIFRNILSLYYSFRTYIHATRQRIFIPSVIAITYHVYYHRFQLMNRGIPAVH